MEVLPSNQPNLTLLICSYHCCYLRFYFLSLLLPIIWTWRCPTRKLLYYSCYFGHFEDKQKVNLVQVSIPAACFTSKIQKFELPSFHSAWHQNRNAVSLKKSHSSWFSAVWPFQVLEISLCASMLVLNWKEKAFIEKVNSRCFCWFPGGHIGAPKRYKGAWNVSAKNSETVGHKDLRLGKIVYILVFYNISFPWLLPLDGFQFIPLLRDS